MKLHKEATERYLWELFNKEELGWASELSHLHDLRSRVHQDLHITQRSSCSAGHFVPCQRLSGSHWRYNHVSLVTLLQARTQDGVNLPRKSAGGRWHKFHIR